MKDITVLDVLELPIMSNAKLKAGHGGLKNTIQYVNILDNRYDDTDTSAHLPKYGENFYITSMYYGQDLSLIHICWNWTGCIVAVVSMAIALILYNVLHIGVFNLNGVAVAIVLYVIVEKFFPSKSRNQDGGTKQFVEEESEAVANAN